MVKTKKMRNLHGKTKKFKIDARSATMQGIGKWYTHVFEQLGWMILAKNKGYDDKVEVYKNSLNRLSSTIENKMRSVHEHDRKEDLQIMHNNLKLLIEHAKKDF
jgi:hypothetical protein